MGRPCPGWSTPGCSPAPTGNGPGGSSPEALASDLHDVQGGTTAEGIHLGAMAGTVDLAQRCYTGLETREDVLWLNPSLPEELDGLDFDVRYRGNWGINLHLTPDRLRVSVPASCAAPVRIGVKGEVVELAPGTNREFPP
jgi:trehalose/maltose hydrolase-like predicted phosphorylase